MDAPGLRVVVRVELSHTPPNAESRVSEIAVIISVITIFLLGFFGAYLVWAKITYSWPFAG
jgi:hypothetical protein